MTPLAMHLTKNLLLPKNSKGRAEETRFAFEGTHFFECTAISDPKILGDMASVLLDVETQGGYTAPYRFAPAEKTWLEFRNATDGSRFALLCVSDDNSTLVTLYSDRRGDDGIDVNALGYVSFADGSFEVLLQKNDTPERRKIKIETPHVLATMARDAVRMFVLINLPHVLGRKQNIAHKGAARKLGLAVGKFPLHGWTELSLDVHLTPKRDDDTMHEAGFTGGKCLHFCRAHLRLRNGKIEVVKSHWRGDPALGIKRTRYKMQPPRHVHA